MKTCYKIIGIAALLFNFIFASHYHHLHYMNTQQSYNAQPAYILTSEQLQIYLSNLPGRKAIVIVTKDNCPACKIYKPLVERFVSQNPGYASRIVFFYITAQDVAQKNEKINWVRNTFGINNIPATLLVGLNSQNQVVLLSSGFTGQDIGNLESLSKSL